MPASALVEIRGVTKDYRGLRPLRIEHLTVREGESIALLGFDHLTAEVLVNLVTGGLVPDTGVVTVFGRPTSEIRDADSWLETVDRFGLVSERAVLLDQLTTEQNLALPFSLDVDDMSRDVRERVRRLAAEVAIDAELLGRPVADLTPAARLRVRLGRALALEPRVLLAEHPNATLPAGETAPFAADLARVVAARGLAMLVMTADHVFARAVADQVLDLQPSTGALRRSRGWARWFS